MHLSKLHACELTYVPEPELLRAALSDFDPRTILPHDLHHELESCPSKFQVVASGNSEEEGSFCDGCGDNMIRTYQKNPYVVHATGYAACFRHNFYLCDACLLLEVHTSVMVLEAHFQQLLLLLPLPSSVASTLTAFLLPLLQVSLSITVNVLCPGQQLCPTATTDRGS